jgi:glycerol-3-phosphate cytidylyltransferase
MINIKDRGEIVLGFTCGAFDLLHAGHLLMLKECSEQCDRLIVGLQTDPTLDRPEKHKPVESIEERKIRLEACKYIDRILIYDTEADLHVILESLKPDVRFLGKDHKGKPFTGDDLSIKIIFNSREHNYSSSNLIERIKKHE